MKVYILSFGILILFCTSILSGQTYETFDVLDWSQQSGLSGSTDGGLNWSALGYDSNDCDSNGYLGPRDEGFYFSDWEGTCGCDCIPDDPNPLCGANNSTLDILFSPFILQSYCQIRISFDINGNDELRCGLLDDKDPIDYNIGVCNDDRGEWEGTDFISVTYSVFFSDGANVIYEDLICGKNGLGRIEREFSDAVVVQISISGGTQNNGIYEIGNITAEGVLKELSDLRIFAINHSANGYICENSGLPLILQTNAESTLDFVWMGPQGVISTKPVVQLNDLNLSMSGPYMVQVTDRNGCVSIAQTLITIKNDADGDCRASTEFSQLFTNMCSDVVLPSVSDNGIRGAWSPSATLANYAGQTVRFTFTPDDPSINQFTIEITIDDLSQLPFFAKQPSSIPIFCNGPGLSYDLIDIYQMNLDYALTINGDGEIFNFVINDSYVHQRENEIRNVSFEGITPGVKNYFIEAISPCGIPFIKSFQFIVIGTESLVIDTTLCYGDYLNYFGSTIISDTVIYDSECATALEFHVKYLDPQINVERFEGSFCAGDQVYVYDTLDAAGNWVGLSIEEYPQYTNALDTVFSSSYFGEYILPLPAQNGCDSIVRVEIEWPIPQKFNNINFNLCSNVDTTFVIGGQDYNINSDQPYLQLLVECDSLITINAEIVSVETDTMRATLCAERDTLIEDLQGNFVLFNKDNNQQLFYSQPLTGGCRSSKWVDITFIESEKGVVNKFICQGQSVIIGNQVFTQPVENYELVLAGQNSFGCDSIVVVNVEMLTASIESTPTVITCTNPSAVLTVEHNGEIISWEGPNGFSSEEISPVVTRQGIYKVTIQGPNGCTSTFSKVVSRDVVPPNLIAFGGVINCNNPQIALTANTNGDIVSWTGPDGFTSDEKNPVVSLPGTYMVSAISQNGCLSFDSTIVVENILAPTATLTGGVLTCANSQQVQLNVSTQDIFVEWTGPDGFQSGMISPVVTIAGEYLARITGTNGCEATIAVQVTEDLRAPEVNVTDGVLNCLNDARLTLQAQTTDRIIGWTGPNGFTSNEAFPEIDQPGVYMVTIEADNGCTTQESLQIVENKTQSSIIVSDTTITCSSPSIPLIAMTDGIIESWSGPDGYNTTDLSPIVSEPGSYTVVVINEISGCKNMATVEIALDTMMPILTVNDGIIDCNNPEISLDMQTNASNVLWIGPNGFTSTELTPIISMEGSYTVTATSENGCSQNAQLEVKRDENLPTASLTGGVLTCANSRQIQLNVSTQDIFVEWTGPDGFQSVMTSPVVTNAGEYFARITGTNGCEATIAVQVTEDLRAPDVNVTDGLLNCLNDGRLTLQAQTVDRIIGWTGPNGFTSIEAFPEIDQPGEYIVTAEADNGCTTQKTIIIDRDTIRPMVSSADLELNCSNPEVNLLLSTDGQLLSWTGPNGFNSTDFSPNVDFAGVYTGKVIATNGCVDSIRIMVTSDTISPLVTTNDVVIDCKSEVYRLNAQTNGAGIVWSGPNGYRSTDSDPIVTLAGEYIVTVMSSNGCMASAQATVTIDQEAPIAKIELNSEYSCSDGGAILSALTDVDSLVWAGPNGFKSIDETITVYESGDYMLTTTGINGCNTNESISINFSEPKIQIGEVIGSCEGVANGRFSIEGLTGATPPFVINGIGDTFTISTFPFVFDQLEKGTYNIIITDANGCISVESVQIFEDETPIVEIDVITIDPIGSYDLMLNFSGQPDSVVWANVPGLSCYDCLNPQVNIEDNANFSVTVYDKNGCSASASVSLSGNGIGTIYVPNIFTLQSPNGNNRFYPQGNFSKETFYDMSIFDRWGNEVYLVENALLNDPEAAWKGTSKGVLVSSGVYVYCITAYNDFGAKKVLKGDITFLR